MRDTRKAADRTSRPVPPTLLGPAPLPEEPVLDRRIQSEIGLKLRSFYGQLAAEPLPDRFLDLVARLDQGRDGEGR